MAYTVHLERRAEGELRRLPGDVSKRYGSCAKGAYGDGSDIDVTLCGGEDLTLRARPGIADELDDLLLPYTIDLSILRDSGDSDVLKQIERVGAALYGRRQELIDEKGGG